jgi:hypothetical protein
MIHLVQDYLLMKKIIPSFYSLYIWKHFICRMEFEERVERFFKQFKTCLGVDPDLKAEFKSTSPLKDDTIEGAVYDATGEVIMEVIQSPRLPLEYTWEDKKHMDAYVPLDYDYQFLIAEFEIDPKYKVHTECININKARIREDYTIDEAKLICRDYYEEHWEDGILYPMIIVEHIKKWLKQVSGENMGLKELMPETSKLLYTDVPPVEDVLKELYDRIRSERDAIHQTLMECFKDKPVRNSPPNDLSVQFGNTEAPTDSSPEKKSTKGLVFENNFDDTHVDEVYYHFYAGFIYEKDRDRQKDYLSESDLHKFLKAAFEKKEPPKKLFTFKNHKTKAQIYKPFHKYFKVVAVKRKRTEAEKKKGTDAAIYASLLEDYFHNYTSVKTNFTKYSKDD